MENPQPVALVVDDDERSRKLMEIVLGIEGYRVVTAASGARALELIAVQRPDVALVDCVMPGMDGMELCRRIRLLPQAASLPLVMLSGMDGPESRRAALAAGADDFVVKPFDRDDLRDRLARLVRRDG